MFVRNVQIFDAARTHLLVHETNSSRFPSKTVTRRPCSVKSRYDVWKFDTSSKNYQIAVAMSSNTHHT